MSQLTLPIKVEEPLSSGLVLMLPRNNAIAELHVAQRFQGDFISSLRYPETNRGVLTAHLFHMLEGNHHFTDDVTLKSLSGAQAWARHIDQAERENRDVGMWGGDQLAIRHALENGLVERLPECDIEFYSYFCGTPNAFMAKEMQVIRAVRQSTCRPISAIVTVDLVAQFAKACIAVAVDLGADIDYAALQADAFNGHFVIDLGDRNRSRRPTPVVLATGGTFANTITTVQNPDPMVNAATCLAKIRSRHGIGCVVIETCDGDRNVRSLKRKYSITQNFAAFILSAFSRAASQSIITDPKYDIFRHWKAASRVKNGAVELLAIAKDSHTLPLVDREIHIPQGTEVTVILSQKWGIDERCEIAKMAGLEVDAVFARRSHPKNFVMVYKVGDGAPCPEVKRRLDIGWTP